MSALSDNLKATALRILTKYGEAVTFTRTTYDAYSPTTLSKPVISTTAFTGYAAPVDYANSNVPDDTIKQKDVKVYVNAVSTVPQVGDQLTLSSTNYRVMEVLKHVVNGTTVLYELVLRV